MRKMKRIIAVLLSMMMLCTMACSFSVNAEPDSGTETENNEAIEDLPEKIIEADEGEITIEVENEETESAPAEQAGQTPDVNEDMGAIEEDENVKEITPLDPEPSGEQNAEMAMVIQRAEDKGISLREAAEEIEAEKKEAERQAYAEKYQLDDVPIPTPSLPPAQNSNALMGPVQQQTVQVNAEDSLLSRVACGTSHYIFLQDDGTVVTWGLYADNSDNISSSHVPEYPTPTQVAGLSSIISVSATEDFGHALAADGTIWIWGGNLKIEVGSSMTNAVQLEGVEDVVSISAGEEQLLALKSDGTVWEWTESESLEEIAPPTPVKDESGNTLSGITAISAGTDHNLALSQDGTIYAWGDNFYGQLGDGTRESRDYAAPIQNNTEAANIVKISAEDGYSILEDADGGRWAWGKSDDIEGLTFDTHLWTVTSLDAEEVSVQADSDYPPVGVKEITRNGKMGLALCTDGTVWQRGTYTYTVVPLDPDYYPEGMCFMYVFTYDTEWSQTQGLHSDVEIPEVPVYPVSASAFNNTQSMVVIDGYLMSAGDNNWGQLGDGTNTASKFPEFVIDYQDFEMDDVKKVSCGYGFDLILTEDGRVWSVGCADNGKLGVGETEHTNKVYPVRGKNGNGFLRDFVDISAGYKHGIAVKNDGSLWAWGHNSVGQLGDGTKVSSDVPVRVKGANGEDWLKNVVSAYANASTSMALESDGTVYMWGNNDKGQLGDGTKTNRQTPVQVKGENGQGYLTNIRQIATAEGCSIALDNTGKVWTWGGNQNGRLGDGTTNDRYYPGKVLKQDGTELSNIVSISVGYYFCAAVDEEGKVWTWGKNDHGQLGDSYQQGDRYFADTVSSTEGGGTLYGVTSVSCGRDYALAVQGEENIVLAWGSNQYGQFGIGTSGEETYTPVVAFDSDVYRDMTWLKAQMKNRQTVIPAQDSIILPKEGPNGSSISWTSSNNYYLDTNGNVRHPDQYGSDIEVTLTGVVQKDGMQDSETFTVKILQNTQIEPSTEVPIRTLGFEYDQRYPDTDSAIEAPQINSVTVKVIDEEEGVYRFYIRDDQYSVDPSSEKHFFFWTSREGTFLPVEGCTDYSQAQFTVDEELRNKKVKIIVGLGDGLGYIDRKAIILQGETTEVQQESVSLAENAVVQAMEQSLPEAAVAGEYAVNLAVGIDTSMEMLEFDPGNTKAWQMSIEGLIESAPENSAFHVVTSRTEETEHFSKTEAINALSYALEDGYSGNQDEIELLEKTAQMLYNGNAGNKAAVIFVKGIEKPEEFEAKVEELEASGIAVYTMVLGGGYTGSKANIYNCESELDLRLNIAALYGAFSDMSTAQNGGILRANAAAAVSENYTSDFREEKHKVPTDTTATQFGKSIISVLNIYGCIPISAQKYSGTTTYSLFSSDDEADENINMHSAQSVYNLLTGNAAGLYANTAIPMYNFFDEMESEFDWKNENIDALIEKNLKYRFPVVAKMGSGDNTKYAIITGQNANGYTYSSYGTVNNFTPEKVIDTYQYLLDVAKDAKNITDMVSKENSFYNEVRFQLPTDGAVKARSFTENAQGNIAGYANGIAISYQTQLEEDKEIKYGYFSTASYADNTKIVMGVEANYTGSMPDVYNMNKLYNVIKYSDLQATQLDAWYYPYLFEATNKGIIGGDTDQYENGQTIAGDGSELYFNPDKPVSRAEFLKMVIETADVSEEDKAAAEIEISANNQTLYQSIKDHWAKEYLCFGVGRNLISAEQAMGADEELMRTEAAYIVTTMFLGNQESVRVASSMYEYNVDMSCEKNTYWMAKTAFADQTTAEFGWNASSIYQLYMNNIMEGNDEGNFNPAASLRRSEAAKIVCKCLFELDGNIETVRLIFEGYDESLQFNINISRPSSGWPEEYNIYAARSGYYFVGIKGTNLSGNDYSLQKRVEYEDDTYGYEEMTDDFTQFYGEGNIPEELDGIQSQGYEFKRYYVDKNTALKLRNISGNVTDLIVKDPQDGDIAVKQKGDGKYIFSNSPETITDIYVADNDTGNGSWIMRNAGLGPDNYTLALYHHTKLTYPVYIDAEFYAQTDTEITFTRFGMGKPEGLWTGINIYAQYIGRTIVESAEVSYYPFDFTDLPYTVTIPAGQRVWLSDIYKTLYRTNNYPFIGGTEGETPVFGMMDFTITSGSADVNLMAYKDGYNSPNFNWNGDGSYVFENHHKGVADSLPETSAELWFEINDSMADQTVLPGRVFNGTNPLGKDLENVVEFWYTHINPQSDIWTGRDGNSLEFDMLALKYKDENKKNFYGKNYTTDSEKDDIWVFDTLHTQVRTNNVNVVLNDADILILQEEKVDGDIDYEAIHPNFKPNDFLYNTDLTMFNTDIQNQYSYLLAASLGNYGVVEKYRVNVTNTGAKPRYLCYELVTGGNMVIECNGNYILSKHIPPEQPEEGEEEEVSNISRRKYAIGVIEPNTTTTIEFSVVLPTADNAGLGNKLYIRDNLIEETAIY